jgi:antitoxin CptB
VETIIPPQLRWACRRGMLELDVLLGNFLEEAYLSASKKDQKQFVKLLNCNDQELFMWLTGKEIPTQTDLTDIVGKIRHHAKIRKHATFL